METLISPQIIQQLVLAQSKNLIKGYSYSPDGYLYIDYTEETKRITKVRLQNHFKIAYNLRSVHDPGYHHLCIAINPIR